MNILEKMRLPNIMGLAGMGTLFAAAASAGSLPNAYAEFGLVDNAAAAGASPLQVTENIESYNPVSYSLGGLDPQAGGTLTSGAIDPIAAVTISDLNPPYPTAVNVPELAASTILDGVHVNSADASVYLSYNFIAVGPPNVEVPLDLWINHGVTPNTIGDEIGAPDTDFSLQGSDSVIFVGSQNGSVTSQTLGAENLDIEYHSESPPEDTFSVYTSSYSLTGFISTGVTSDLIDTIEMTATSYVSIGTAALASGSINTIVDPYITIDPSFALADEFTLEISPDIGNDLISSGPALVPEPSTFWLLAGVLLLLGGVKWTRILGPRA